MVFGNAAFLFNEGFLPGYNLLTIMYLINYSYLIQIIYTQLYGFKHSSLKLMICKQINIVHNHFKKVNISYWFPISMC